MTGSTRRPRRLGVKPLNRAEKRHKDKAGRTMHAVPIPHSLAHHENIEEQQTLRDKDTLECSGPICLRWADHRRHR